MNRDVLHFRRISISYQCFDFRQNFKIKFLRLYLISYICIGYPAKQSRKMKVSFSRLLLFATISTVKVTISQAYIQPPQHQIFQLLQQSNYIIKIIFSVLELRPSTTLAYFDFFLTLNQGVKKRQITILSI